MLRAGDVMLIPAATKLTYESSEEGGRFGHAHIFTMNLSSRPRTYYDALPKMRLGFRGQTDGMHTEVKTLADLGPRIDLDTTFADATGGAIELSLRSDAVTLRASGSVDPATRAATLRTVEADASLAPAMLAAMADLTVSAPARLSLRARDVAAVAISIFAVYVTLQSKSEDHLKHAWTVQLPVSHYANGEYPESNERMPSQVLAGIRCSSCCNRKSVTIRVRFGGQRCCGAHRCNARAVD